MFPGVNEMHCGLRKNQTWECTRLFVILSERKKERVLWITYSKEDCTGRKTVGARAHRFS